VGQPADLEHRQDRAIVGQCVESAGADRGEAMQQRRIDAMLNGEAQVGVTEWSGSPEIAAATSAATGAISSTLHPR
jgi:hypothetical protein